jgi:hypothetical protein
LQKLVSDNLVTEPPAYLLAKFTYPHGRNCFGRFRSTSFLCENQREITQWGVDGVLMLEAVKEWVIGIIGGVGN